MRKLFSLSLAFLMATFLVGCSFEGESHSSSNKTKSTSIELNNKISTIESIKPQTDKLASSVSDKLALKEVFVSLQDGNFDTGTVSYIYYSESNGYATKMTIKIDTAQNKIVETKVQKGSPDEVGGAMKMNDVNTSKNIRDFAKKVCESEDFKSALTTEFGTTVFDTTGQYTLDLDFFVGSTHVVATKNSDKKNFFDSNISNS